MVKVWLMWFNRTLTCIVIPSILNINNEVSTHRRTLYVNYDFPETTACYIWHYFSLKMVHPLVPKHVGDAPLIFR